MSPVQPTDLLLVNRAGVDYNAPVSQVVADATETAKGIAEIATTAEVKAGTDDQRIVTPLKLKGFQQQFTIQSATPPTLVTHPNIVSGTIWVDTSQNPPVINLWDPTANSGAGGWAELSSVPKPINPGPSDFAANPAFVSGTGTQADPFIITPSTVTAPGGAAQSAQQLSLTGLKVGAAINWTDHSVGTGTRFQQTNGIVPASGNVSLRLAYSDTPNSTASAPYTGDLQLGTTYFRWVVTQQATSVTTPTITSPSAAATDLGEIPTFTSSAFAGTGTTHASSDWQVTLATDTTFATPVVQSMADATHKVSWNGGPLQASIDYIVRVRHNGTGGISSAWSAVVAFKTKKSFIASASPGDVWITKNGAAMTKLTAPVKIINLASDAASYYGVGVDGKVYKCDAAGSTTFTMDPDSPADVVQTAVDTNGQRKLYLKSDSTVASVGGKGSVAITLPPGFKAGKIGTLGCTTQLLYAVALDGSVYAGGLVGKLGDFSCDASFQLVPLVLPGGRAVKEICGTGGGNYDAPNIAILATDGTLWSVTSDVSIAVDGFKTSSTMAAPRQVAAGTFFSSISTTGGNYQTYGSISADEVNGDIWYGATLAANNASGAARTFSKVADGSKWRESWYGPFAANNAVAGLKQDGYIYVSPAASGLSFVKVANQPKPLTTVGNIRSVMNLAGDTIAVIYPS